MTDTKKFIRVKSGAVYRWTPMLAKRKDAIIVGPQEYADWTRAQGAENEFTKKYPEREGIPAPKKNEPKPRSLKKAASRSKPKTMVSSEEEPDALKEIIGDGANLLTGN